MNEELWERFKVGDLWIHCENEDECKAFVKLCFDNGFTWRTKPYTWTYWNAYKDTISYHILRGKLKVQSCSGENSEIINYKQLMNKDYVMPKEFSIFSYLEGDDNE